MRELYHVYGRDGDLVGSVQASSRREAVKMTRASRLKWLPSLYPTDAVPDTPRFLRELDKRRRCPECGQ